MCGELTVDSTITYLYYFIWDFIAKKGKMHINLIKKSQCLKYSYLHILKLKTLKSLLEFAMNTKERKSINLNQTNITTRRKIKRRTKIVYCLSILHVY